MNHRILGILVACALCCWSVCRGQDDTSTVHRFEDGVGGEMWYRLYLPDDYDENMVYPLVMFLHGNDGSNIRPVEDPDDVSRAPSTLVSAMRDGEYSSILMAPQLESGNWGTNDNDRLILDAFESLQESYQVEQQQRYVTGLSFGGYGTWHMIDAYPGYFAAGAPIAGFGNPAIADNVRETPVWVFHGDSDNVVDVQASRTMVEAVRQAGGQPRYSEIPFGPHEIWSDVYDVDYVPQSATIQLDANTTDKTFRLLATVPDEGHFGLRGFEVELTGVETIRNLAPKSDFTPSEGVSLAFTENRSAENQVPITAEQKSPLSSPETTVLGIGQRPGMLPGAGTGEGEVQPVYDAPVVLAEGTYTDLSALDFAAFDNPAGLPIDVSIIHQGRSGRYSGRPAVAFGELLHDGDLVYRTGSHMNLYPWLFSQRLVPEPSSASGMVGVFLAVVAARRRRRKRTTCADRCWRLRG